MAETTRPPEGRLRYWGLFWLAAGLAVHAFVVARVLHSGLFFMMLFFWGWVAASAMRGELKSARNMVVTMLAVLACVLASAPFAPEEDPHAFAYRAVALYPALVSWVTVFFYIRHLAAARAQRQPGGYGSLTTSSAPSAPM